MADVCRALEESDLYGPAWRALRRKRPDLASELEGAARQEWISAEAYAALVDETLAISGGTDRLRALGRAWVKKELASGGRYATMRRSWLRTFGDGPGEVIQLAPHLWRASMRKNGRVVKGDAGRGFVRMVLEEAPAVRRSAAWQALLEGSLQGLLELSSPTVQVQLGPSAVDPELVEGIVLWPTR
ncbi:MAG: hypothetical protein JJ863_03930 [Deltaproteobacteria bacterium]|nr:hypothetical protein [Deltaproteobacteria bacterium]